MTEYFPYDQFQDEFDLDIDLILEQSIEGEETRLNQELERIEQQLEERIQIQEDAVDQLQSKLDWYTDRLEKLYLRTTGKTERKQVLKNRIEEFYREIRREQRGAWSDKQELKAQRRNLLRELSELDDADQVFELF